MSNHFSCDFNNTSNINVTPDFTDGFLGQRKVNVRAYYFFYCAQPLATSAAIQNVRTNLHEYYVKQLKINFFVNGDVGFNAYMMVFVLNVPDSYMPYGVLGSQFKLSYLPSHTVPECVLYYNLFRAVRVSEHNSTFDVKIDIKKPFKVLPSHKLTFVCYVFSSALQSGTMIKPEGTAEVFFEVN